MAVSHQRLRKLLKYDPRSGVFVALVKRGKITPGMIAGGCRGDKYVHVMIDGDEYYAHRLAWFYMKGKWPAHQIDHIDGDKKNNKWDNLREATHSQNLANSKTRRHNKLGIKGVRARGSRFSARITSQKREIFLGVFDTASEAKIAYDAAAKRFYGEYANGG